MPVVNAVCQHMVTDAENLTQRCAMGGLCECARRAAEKAARAAAGAPLSFKEAPVSIGELKAKKSGLARDASPRDALVELLRDIDSGKISADFIVIGMGKRLDDGQVESRFKFAGPGNSYEYLGLASRMWWHAND